MRFLIRLVFASLVGMASLGLCAPDTSAQTHTYDAPLAQCIGVHQIGTVEIAPPQLTHSERWSNSRVLAA